MSHEPNNIDQLLRERLEGFEMAPPADVWTNTSAALNASRRKRRIFVWFFLSIGAVVLLLGGLWYFNGSSTGELLAKEPAITGTGKNTSKSTGSNTEKGERNDLGATTFNHPSDVNATSATSLKASTSTKIEFNSAHQNQFGTTNKKGKSSKVGGSDQIQKADKTQAGLETPSPANSLKPLIIDGIATGSETPPVNATLDENLKSTSIGFLPLIDLSPFYVRHYSPAASSFNVNHSDVASPFWKRFSLEGSIGFSTYHVKSTLFSDSVDVLDSLLADPAYGRHSFDARLGVNYHFNKNFSFQTGLEFYAAQEKYTFIGSEATTITYNDTVSSYFDTTLNQTVYVIQPVSYDTLIVGPKETTNYYKMLTLPFQFAWKMDLNPRGQLEFALGGAVSIYGKNDGYTIQNASNTAIPSSEAYRTTGILSLGGSVKYIHRFGVHHSVYVEPWARIGITNMSTSMLPYDTRRNQYGIRIGYRFYF